MSNVQDTIAMIKKSHTAPSGTVFAKGQWRTDSPSSNPTVGPKFYNLDPIVQQLYPVVTPLLKIVPRVKSAGGNAQAFKQITGVNSNKMFSGGVEGLRGGLIDFTFRDKTIAFKTSILETRVTWQSELASQGLTPQNRALAAQTLINAFVLDEHKNMIGANGTLALGQTPTPVGASVADAGSLAAGDLVAVCVALSYEGKNRSSVADGVSLDRTITNSMGETINVKGGHALKSAASAAVTVTAGAALQLAVAAVPGACGYAWFVGATAAAARLVAVTAGNTVSVTALNTTSQLATAVPAADNSAEPLRWDGLLTQMSEAGSGSIIKSLDGDVLTPNGSGGVVEIDEVLQEAYDAFKISYTRLFVSAKQRRKINAAILSAPAGSGAARILIDGGNQGAKAGTFVTEYINPVTGRTLALETLPDLPDNMVLFYSDSVEYQVPNTQNLIEMVMNSDYYQIEYPMISLSYDTGVATYGSLVVRFPPAFGLLTNCAE